MKPTTKTGPLLTEEEAYAAMYVFLEDIYNRTQADYIGSLLGDMSLLKDGGTADPAVWVDWRMAVRKVRDGDYDLDLGIGRSQY